MNPEVSGNFLTMTKNAYARKAFGIDYTLL
jgi:hypothetical protein